MFDQLVLPILLYGSEIWAATDIMKLTKLNEVCTLEDIYSKLPQEKVNVHFCKFILGVSSKSVNMAVMAELGRYPVFIHAVTRMIKYYCRIKNMGKNTLISDALYEREQRSKSGVTTWTKSVQNIIDCLGLNIQQLCQDMAGSEYKKKQVGKQIRTLLDSRYTEYWNRQMGKQHGKLDTYAKIKDKFGYEEYLDCIKVDKHQVALTRLRVSNHRLHVETGRYKRPYIPRHERICELCQEEVEDEFHFICQCPALKTPRQSILGHETLTGNRQTLLSNLLSDFTICSASDIAFYISEAMLLRQNILSPTL